MNTWSQLHKHGRTERRQTAQVQSNPCERRDIKRRRELMDRIRGEFLEMPCISLTAREAARLMGVTQPICVRILRALVHEGALRETTDGRYTVGDVAP